LSVDRVLFGPSRGVSPEVAPGETFIFRKLIGPFLLKLGRTVYEDMRRMEEIVRNSGLERRHSRLASDLGAPTCPTAVSRSMWSVFDGLETPSFTQTPDAIFGSIMAYLPGRS